MSIFGYHLVMDKGVEEIDNWEEIEREEREYQEECRSSDQDYMDFINQEVAILNS